MTTKDKIKNLVNKLNDEQEQAVLSLLLVMVDQTTVKPDTWETQAIQNFEKMSPEEREDGAMSLETYAKLNSITL
ncbi:hypothetical protein [Aerococcus christensenii]|uniref:Uncharacterized protein n=1 Tax=Aerococcus christensenii TaxID=87541 RepID=A0A133XZK7_9LACT|nr:hypothetical protein [Aerococcus christensenii]KXB36388.1 hypothetical protein HMPREF3187_00898 [Aerococcus christensenii]MDK8234607.1 hypothetical protein [Aerococcus christensenii]WEB70444.1 hypothetical protein PUW42_05090 [Aerococcus christensenii]